MIVADGFTGNVMLKLAEGEARVIFGWVREALSSGGPLTKLGAALVRPALRAWRRGPPRPRRVRARSHFWASTGTPLSGTVRSDAASDRERLADRSAGARRRTAAQTGRGNDGAGAAAQRGRLVARPAQLGHCCLGVQARGRAAARQLPEPVPGAVPSAAGTNPGGDSGNPRCSTTKWAAEIQDTQLADPISRYAVRLEPLTFFRQPVSRTWRSGDLCVRGSSGFSSRTLGAGRPVG